MFQPIQNFQTNDGILSKIFDSPLEIKNPANKRPKSDPSWRAKSMPCVTFGVWDPTLPALPHAFGQKIEEKKDKAYMPAKPKNYVKEKMKKFFLVHTETTHHPFQEASWHLHSLSLLPKPFNNTKNVFKQSN